MKKVKIKIWKQSDKQHITYRKSNLNDRKLLIIKLGGFIFQLMKEKNCQPQILYSVKILVSNQGKIKVSSKWRKPKRMCDQYHPKIIARISSLNRKKKWFRKRGSWKVRKKTEPVKL